MKVIVFFLVLFCVPLLNTAFSLIGWFKYKYGKGKERRCKNCFYNVILPSDRDDYIYRTFSEYDRVCRNPATAKRTVSYGAEYFRSLYKNRNKAGWNCPHWIKRSLNQPEVK
jgi:hypothetical protein